MMPHSVAAPARGLNQTRVRGGHASDLPAIGRLFARANTADSLPRVDEAELTQLAGRSRLIVLELQAGELAAVACVTARGVAFVVLDPVIASLELEQRMLGVAEALVASELPLTGAGDVQP